jgi:hypothetical protein
MNLIDEQVVHESFGVGRVLSIDAGIIKIQFSPNIGEKRFQYPYAFERYLKMCRPSAQDFIEKELIIMLDRMEEEKSRREQLRLAEAAVHQAAQKLSSSGPVAKRAKKSKNQTDG